MILKTVYNHFFDRFWLSIVLALNFSACWAADSPRTFSLSELCQEAEGCVASDRVVREFQTRYASWHNQPVIIRGFLYHAEDGRWILCSMPNLKTCCVGRSSKALTQVFAQGDLTAASPDRVITLAGKLMIEPIYDRSGDMTGLFHLTNAERVQEQNVFPSMIWWVLGLVTILTFAVQFRRKGQ